MKADRGAERHPSGAADAVPGRAVQEKRLIAPGAENGGGADLSAGCSAAYLGRDAVRPDGCGDSRPDVFDLRGRMGAGQGAGTRFGMASLFIPVLTTGFAVLACLGSVF